MTMTDETHDPARVSWVDSANDHPDFPIQNLPFGIFDPGDGRSRAGIAIGDRILDLSALARTTLLSGDVAACVPQASGFGLNDVLNQPSKARRAFRRQLSSILHKNFVHRAQVEPLLHPSRDVRMLLPATIGDYTDFYAGIIHARTVGSMLRPDNPLMPNYKHVPIGYHGRASSINVSGRPVRRPNGQLKPADSDAPHVGPTARLDYEVELAIWIGVGNEQGRPIPIDDAEEHIAGLSLLNDWSARDVQAWEYQPLGPFLAKNFASTLSPWIITQEALAPFRVAPNPRAVGDPAPLSYLVGEADREAGAYSIELTVSLRSRKMREAEEMGVVLGRSSANALYWTPAQMIAHHSMGGCNLRPGDLLGTGTISSEGATGSGSMMELSSAGRTPFALPSGEVRTFLEDFDEVQITGRAVSEGYRSIGFGECRAVIEPAIAID